MARGGVDFNGIDSRSVTYAVAAATKAIVTISGVAVIEGKCVALTGNREVGLGSDNDKFHGVVDKYEADGYATVQTGGYREDVPGVSGSLPSRGDMNLVVNGSGAVKTSAAVQTRSEVVSVDNTASVNTVCLIIG